MPAKLLTLQDATDQLLQTQLDVFSQQFPHVNVLVLRPEDLPYAPDQTTAPHRLGAKSWSTPQLDARSLALEAILQASLPTASFGEVEVEMAAKLTSANVFFEDVLSVSKRGCVSCYDLYGCNNALIVLEPRWWRQSHEMASITGLPVSAFASLAERPSAVFSLAHELNHVVRQQAPEFLTQFHFEQSGDLAGLSALDAPKDQSFYKDWRLLSSFSAALHDDKMAYAFGLTLIDATKQEDEPEDHILAFVEMKRAAVGPLLPDAALDISVSRLFNNMMAKRRAGDADALLTLYEGEVSPQKLQQRIGHLAEAVQQGALSPLATEMSVASLAAAKRRLPSDFLPSSL